MIDDDHLFSEFEKRLSVTADTREESLVDEIMSHINSQTQNDSVASYDEICDVDVHSGIENTSTSIQNTTLGKNDRVPPVPSVTSTDISKTEIDIKTQESGQQGSSGNQVFSSIPHSSLPVKTKTLDPPTESLECKSQAGDKHGGIKCPSSIKHEDGLQDTLAELRTRLVQLKQER